MKSCRNCRLRNISYFHKFPPKLPNDEVIFNTQKQAQHILAEHGYAQYEVSAYSQANRQCQHNVNYWQFGDYLGIGAGAHGKITPALTQLIIRTFKPKSPEQYLANTHKNGGADLISIAELPLEFVMNHLGLKQGFTISAFEASTGLTIDSLEPVLSQCLKDGLLIYQNNYYCCTEQGWNFMDNVLEKFITHRSLIFSSGSKV